MNVGRDLQHLPCPSDAPKASSKRMMVDMFWLSPVPQGHGLKLRLSVCVSVYHSLEKADGCVTVTSSLPAGLCV